MNIGVICVLAFIGAVALRDVFFGGFFQQYDFFQVVLLATALTVVLFGIAPLTRRGQWDALVAAHREAVFSALGTACAWLCYLSALKLLEPAIVNAIHTGTGAIVLLAMGALRLNVARPAHYTRIELTLWTGVLAILLLLAAVVLSGYSGLADRTLTQNLQGLGFAFASGIFIAPASDIAKRMSEKGMSAASVLAVRQAGTMTIAGAMVAFTDPTGIALSTADILLKVGVASVLLMALPLYLLQQGLARTSALSIWVMQALGPCLIFAAQLTDGRLHPSPWTLACLTSFSVLAIGANVARKFERASA
jgi:hypothetical protein